MKMHETPHKTFCGFRSPFCITLVSDFCVRMVSTASIYKKNIKPY